MVGVHFSGSLPSQEEIHQFYLQMGWAQQLKLSAQQLHLAHQNSWLLACAWQDGQLIGLGRVVSDGVLHAFLCGLGVLPAFRNQGIGRTLVGQLVAGCQAQGMTTQLICEQALLPYYESLGFAAFGLGLKAQ